jgi:hypothetical protein
MTFSPLRVLCASVVNGYFSGKRLCKPQVIVMGFVVALSLYWVLQTVSEILALRAPCENVNLSALGVGIQSLKTETQTVEFAHIAGYEIWDIPVAERKVAGKAGAGKAGAAASFAQKEFNKIPAVYSLADEKYRWEFYGVVANGRKRAVFFNPARKGENFGWRQLVTGEPLDDDLALKEIGKGRVVVFFSKEQKDFVLELFRVNQR